VWGEAMSIVNGRCSADCLTGECMHYESRTKGQTQRVVPGEVKRKSHRARGHPSKSGKMAGMEAVVGRLVSHGREVEVMGSRMQGFINRNDSTSAKSIQERLMKKARGKSS